MRSMRYVFLLMLVGILWICTSGAGTCAENYDKSQPIDLELTVSPPGNTYSSGDTATLIYCVGDTVTFTLNAIDVDAYGDPVPVYDDLVFTGWPIAGGSCDPSGQPEKYYSGEYGATCTLTLTEATTHNITVSANDVPTYADDDPISPITITLVATPIPPTSASANPSVVCEGQSSTLTAIGGSGDSCKWYTGSCGGTLVGTGTSIVVSPSSTTTYYVRWENGCGNSDCATTTVFSDDWVVAWGHCESGVCDIPSPNSDFVAVSAGGHHNLGLKCDGSVVAWGWNPKGECTVPSPNSGFVAVAAGGYHSLGMQSNGSIVAWGWNDYGQCDVPSPNSGFVAVSAGQLHSIGLKSNGSIVAWGSNVAGQCTVPSPNSDFVAVAAGAYYSLGLKSDGSVIAWGNNNNGQCTVPSPNTNFVSIAGGIAYSVGLKSDGSIVAWGDNGFGQCDVPSPNSDFVAIAAGDYHILGLKSDSSVVAWGRNDHNQCAVPSPNSDFVAISGGSLHNLGLKAGLPVAPASASANPATICSGASSTLTSAGGWGDTCKWYTGDCGETLVGTGTSIVVSPTSTTTYHVRWENIHGNSSCATTTVTNNSPVAPTSASASPAGLCEGVTTTVTLTATGGSGDTCKWYVGSCGGTLVGTGTSITVTPSSATTYCARWESSCGNSDCATTTVFSNGSVVVWGNNSEGQRDVPSPNSSFIAVAGGYEHSLGLKYDGSVAAWGDDYYGQCTVPSPNSDFVAIACGTLHSLGLTSEHSVVAWGRNDYGQCTVPSPNSYFVAIAGGTVHSLGLKSGGSVVAWGNDDFGQCGLPSPNWGFVAIAAGGYHNLGLNPDGSVVAWGYNSHGQCNVPSPKSAFVAIAAGTYHSLGLESDGSVVAWGDDYYGQCTVPSPNSDFVAIAARRYYSLGLKSDGTVVAWGYNGNGQCDVPSPNSGYVAIAAGGEHSLGLRSNTTSPTSVFANPTTVCPGASSTLTAVGGWGDTCKWYTGGCGETLIGTGTSIIVNPTTTTTYYVRWDSTCDNSTCATTTVTVYPRRPSYVSANPSPVCTGSNCTLTAAGGSGDICRWYTGSCGGTLVGTGTSITVNPTSTTTYYVRWETASCNSTCVARQVQVDQWPVAPTSATASPSAICIGSSTTLTAIGGSGTRCWWYANSCQGGTFVGVGTSIVVSPTSTTTYYARWESACGSSDCASTTVTVSTSEPTAPTSATASPATISACGSSTLTAVGGSGDSCKWYTDSCGQTLVGTGTSIVVSPLCTQTYFVRWESGICTSDCAVVTVTVSGGICCKLLVFCIDCTGSSGGGADIRDGICATVDYLSSSGVKFGGVKFNDYSFNTCDFTTNTTSFKAWVNAEWGGGGTELPFEALIMGKNMFFAAGAFGGGYLALATDEDSDSTQYTAQQAAAILQAAGCKVFVDPRSSSLVSYYEPIAVNGGAIETTSLGTFTFPLMRQAITGQ